MLGHAESSPAEEVGDTLTIKTRPFLPDPPRPCRPTSSRRSTGSRSGAARGGVTALPRTSWARRTWLGPGEIETAERAAADRQMIRERC